jgi:hypothetical protein
MGPAVAGPREAPEYEVKAACLFYFAKFTDWPTNAFTDARSPLRIGVLGQDPFGNALDNIIKNKTVRGRPVEIIRSRQWDDLKSCQVLFISRSEALPELMSWLEGRKVLTVGESNDFLQKHGMIRFVIVDNKVRFEINNDAVEQAGLTLSSEVLRLAQR